MAVSNELRCNDCLGPDGLAALGDGSIDIVMCDPPYSEHVHGNGRSGSGRQVPTGTRRVAVPVELGFEHISQVEIESAADHFARLARRWTLVFCDVESSHLWAGALRSAGLEYLRTMAWQKLGGAPQFTGDRPAVAFEAIVVAHRPGKKHWNGGGKAGWYAVPTAIDRDRSGLDARIHTTQKPVALMEQLIADFTDPGELILDPYAGSGTTGVAARRLGRRFLGFERDPEMAAKAQARLAREAPLPAGYHDDPRQGVLL